MHYRDTLKQALDVMDERQQKYSTPEINFARIASLASMSTSLTVSMSNTLVLRLLARVSVTER